MDPEKARKLAAIDEGMERAAAWEETHPGELPPSWQALLDLDPDDLPPS